MQSPDELRAHQERLYGLSLDKRIRHNGHTYTVSSALLLTRPGHQAIKRIMFAGDPRRWLDVTAGGRISAQAPTLGVEVRAVGTLPNLAAPPDQFTWRGQVLSHSTDGTYTCLAPGTPSATMRYVKYHFSWHDASPNTRLVFEQVGEEPCKVSLQSIVSLKDITIL